jgi:hypothetical protein
MSTATRSASWFFMAVLVAAFLAGIGLAEDVQGLAFFQTGTSRAVDFAAMRSTQAFDVANVSASYLMLVFEPSASAKLIPAIVRLAPHARQTVRLSTAPEVESFELRYAVSPCPAPFKTHTDQYHPYIDGETVMCVPVRPALYNAIHARPESILRD